MVDKIFPIKGIGEKGGHVHVLPSDWNPKELSAVLTDHDSGTKSAIQIEKISLPEGDIALIKKDGIISGS